MPGKDPLKLLMSNSKQSSLRETKERSDNLLKVRELLTNGYNKVEAARGRDVVLLFGKMGVGKSTLTNYLLGCSMQKVVDKWDRQKFTAEAVDPRKVKAKMGNDKNTKGITLYPEAYYSEEKIVVCDCPGMDRLEVQSENDEFFSSLNIQMAVQLANKVSAVMFVLDYNSLESERGAYLVKLIDSFRKMVKDFYELEGLIFFVITKAPVELLANPKEFSSQIIGSIGKIIESREAEFKALEQKGIDFFKEKSESVDIYDLSPLVSPYKNYDDFLKRQEDKVKKLSAINDPSSRLQYLKELIAKAEGQVVALTYTKTQISLNDARQNTIADQIEQITEYKKALELVENSDATIQALIENVIATSTGFIVEASMWRDELNNLNEQLGTLRFVIQAPNNVIGVDVFDDFSSKNIIMSRLEAAKKIEKSNFAAKTMKNVGSVIGYFQGAEQKAEQKQVEEKEVGISKNRFQFSQYDGKRTEFNHHIAYVIDDSWKLFREILALPEKINVCNEEIQKLRSNVEEIDYNLDIIDVNLRKYQLKERKKYIEGLQTEVKLIEAKKKVEDMQRELKTIDTSKEEYFSHDINSEKRPWWALLGYTRHVFKYTGKVLLLKTEKEKSKRGEFIEEKMEEADEKGVFKSFEVTYKSGFYEDGEAKISYYVRKKDIEANKLLIAQYEKELPQLILVRNQLEESCKEYTRELNEINDKLEKLGPSKIVKLDQKEDEQKPELSNEEKARLISEKATLNLKITSVQKKKTAYELERDEKESEYIIKHQAQVNTIVNLLRIFPNGYPQTEKFLEQYALFNSKTQVSNRALWGAIERSDLVALQEQVEGIEKRGTRVFQEADNSGNNCLLYAVKVGASFEVIEYLCNKRCDMNGFNSSYETCLHLLLKDIRDERIKVIKFLLKNGLDVKVYLGGFSIFNIIIRELRQLKEQGNSDNKIYILREILLLFVNHHVANQKNPVIGSVINYPIPLSKDVNLPLFHMLAEYGDASSLKWLIESYHPDIRSQYPNEEKGITPLQRIVSQGLSMSLVGEDKPMPVDLNKLEVVLSFMLRATDKMVIEELKKYYQKIAVPILSSANLLSVPTLDPVLTRLQVHESMLATMILRRTRLAVLIVKACFFHNKKSSFVVEKNKQVIDFLMDTLEELPIAVFDSIYDYRLEFDTNFQFETNIAFNRFGDFIYHDLIVYFRHIYFKEKKDVFDDIDEVAKRKYKSAFWEVKDKNKDKIQQFKNYILTRLLDYHQHSEINVWYENVVNKVLCQLANKIYKNRDKIPLDILEKIKVVFMEKVDGEIMLRLSPSKLLQTQVALTDAFLEELSAAIDAYLKAKEVKENKEQMQADELFEIITNRARAIFSEWLYKNYPDALSLVMKGAYTLADRVVTEVVNKTAKQQQDQRIEKNKVQLRNGLIDLQKKLAVYLLSGCWSSYLIFKNNSGVLIGNEVESRVYMFLVDHLFQADLTLLLSSLSKQRDYQQGIFNVINLLEQNGLTAKQIDNSVVKSQIEDEKEGEDFKLKAKAFKIVFTITINRCLNICDALINGEYRQNPNWAENWRNAVDKFSDSASWLTQISSALGNRYGGWLNDAQACLPMVTGVIKLFLHGADSYIQYRNKEEAQNVWDSFGPDKFMANDDLNEMAEYLVNRYKVQLRYASITTIERTTIDGGRRREPRFDEAGSGVIQLGVCTASRFIAHIKAGRSRYYSDDAMILYRMWNTVRNKTSDLLDRGYEEKMLMPTTERLIRSLTVENKIGRDCPLQTEVKLDWKQSGVFDMSGFIVKYQRGEEYYVSSKSKPEIYGFCYIDIKEVERRGLVLMRPEEVQRCQKEFSQRVGLSQLPKLSEIPQQNETKVEQKALAKLVGNFGGPLQEVKPIDEGSNSVKTPVSQLKASTLSM